MVKTVLFALLLAATALAVPRRAIVKQQCYQEAGIPPEPELVISSARQIADNPQVKKYTLCIGRKFGALDEAGALVVETFRSRIKVSGKSDDEADKVLEQCVKEERSPEENLYETFVCIRDKVRNFYLAD